MWRTRSTSKTKSLIGLLLGLLLTLSASGIASAREEPPLSATYAYVLNDNVPVYAYPAGGGGLNTASAVRTLAAGYLWVSLYSSAPIVEGERTWYRINSNEYVEAQHLAIYAPSSFHGVALAGHPAQPFAWLVYSVQSSPKAGEAPLADAPLFTRYTQVTIYEEQQVGDWMWYRIGPDQWIEQRNLGVVKPVARPEGVGVDEKWIEVNLFEQTLAAYEGDRMVYATLVSSGLPYWKTDTGLFRTWAKVRQAKMSGREGFADYYFLEDVPWTVYFNGAFALHTAYWHDRFGFPHSHGCVNLAPTDAQWIYQWATPITAQDNWTMSSEDNLGTWVWVHD